MIQVGYQFPAVNVTVAGADHHSVNAAELFAKKKVVLFALPGAYTPTCSSAHLPGYVVHADEFKAKGVDMIACLSVNDAFVMQAWGEVQNAEHITMLADGGAALTRALGLDVDTGDFGGVRSQRYAMVIDDGVVSLLHVEAAKAFEVSKAEVILSEI
ncbi:MAG: peroxiredoxin [Gammaproteobacteria bacterium]|nr:peroxiredoxin [Gammaproteobacteria bacterium]